MFFQLMLTSLFGIMEVLFVGMAGYTIIAGFGKGAATAYLDFLSKLLVRIALPCLVFTNLVSHFDPGKIELWWMFPLLAVLINVFGVLVSGGYVLIDRNIKNRGEFMALVAFQNGTFLPLAFGQVLFGPDRLPHYLNLLFLYSLLQVPTFFTLAVWLVNSSAGIGQRFKSLANPPNMATVAGLIFAISGWGEYFPERILHPVSSIGSMTAPLAILYVGGIIVTNLVKAKPENWSEPMKATLFKCLICPALASILVFALRPPEYIALFIILQSVMPSAMMIALIASPDEAKQKMIAAAILLTSLVSILSIPVFMGFYGWLYW